jgi:hypothetical protein
LVNGQNENNSEGDVAAWRRICCNAFSVDEFVGAVSQGRRSSPAGADANPGLMDLNPVGIRGQAADYSQSL